MINRNDVNSSRPSLSIIRNFASICPRSSRYVAVMSSLTAIHLEGHSRATGNNRAKSRKVEPSRNIIHIPRDSFSRASSRVVHSWSELMPDDKYAFRDFPDTPGACPVKGRPLLRRIFPQASGSPAITAGKFIISPKW